MPDQYATYASPNLRWGLLLADHPGASISHHVVPAEEVLPPSIAKGGEVVVATIRFPSGTEVTGFKQLPANCNADDYEKTCTKATGRALKRAGYPADMDDLKALVTWRKRQAEIASIAAGQPVAELPAPELDAAAKSHEDHDDDEPVDAEIVEDSTGVSDPPVGTPAGESVPTDSSAPGHKPAGDFSKPATTQEHTREEEAPSAPERADEETSSIGTGQSGGERGSSSPDALDNLSMDGWNQRLNAAPIEIRAKWMAARRRVNLQLKDAESIKHAHDLLDAIEADEKAAV